MLKISRRLNEFCAFFLILALANSSLAFSEDLINVSWNVPSTILLHDNLGDLRALDLNTSSETLVFQNSGGSIDGYRDQNWHLFVESPNGKMGVKYSWSGHFDFMISDFTTGRNYPLPNSLTKDVEPLRFPIIKLMWSGDNKKLILPEVRNHYGPIQKISFFDVDSYVRDVNANQAKDLSQYTKEIAKAGAKMEIGAHTWSPDNSQIFYSLVKEDGAGKAFIYDLKTGQSNVVADISMGPQAWWIHSTTVEYYGANLATHTMGVFSLNLISGQTTLVKQDNLRKPYFFKLSSDGRYMGNSKYSHFLGEAEKRFYVSDIKNNKEVAIETRFLSFDFSPDGKQIAFSPLMPSSHPNTVNTPQAPVYILSLKDLFQFAQQHNSWTLSENQILSIAKQIAAPAPYLVYGKHNSSGIKFDLRTITKDGLVDFTIVNTLNETMIVESSTGELYTCSLYDLNGNLINVWPRGGGLDPDKYSIRPHHQIQAQCIFDKDIPTGNYILRLSFVGPHRVLATEFNVTVP